jgi:hypothetical protein
VSEITVMLSFSLLLRPRYRDTLASRIGWRAEVCPPSLRQAPTSRWNRLLGWLMAPGLLQASPTPDRLPPVKNDFLASIVDIEGPAATELDHRIAQSLTLRELWHLRADLYHLIALNHNQHEAERRLAALNRHFPTRAPRSGFVPLMS